METWVRVARADELPEGQGRAVVAGELRLALFNVGGEYFAIDDTCPHQGASLAEGTLHDGRVVCPLHSWVFDLRTGRCPRETHDPVRAWPTRSVDGMVEVRVP
jgi:NAD(P)H-dependent nitrite reductase small subunit